MPFQEHVFSSVNLSSCKKLEMDASLALLLEQAGYEAGSHSHCPHATPTFSGPGGQTLVPSNPTAVVVLVLGAVVVALSVFYQEHSLSLLLDNQFNFPSCGSNLR
jgi:hypothetical protein